MAGRLEDRLEGFAEQRGAEGFTFDDLAVVAAGTGAELGAVADWLARGTAAGTLLDLGARTLADGTATGSRRYCAAAAATRANRIDLRLAATPESIPVLRRAAADFAEAHAAESPPSIALAVSEAATNAVLHAYPPGESGDVRMVACAEPGRLVVVVRDFGTGMRPRADSPGLGLGLPTIGRVALDCAVEAPTGVGTLIRMHFARTQRRAAS